MRQQGTLRRSRENSTSDPASENSALCSFWLSGNCQYGEHCSFEHDEQKRPEQRDGEGPGFVHPKYRTQLCCYWLKGRCEYGKSCNFLHQKPEGASDSLGDGGPKSALKTQAECHFFAQGFCRYGDRCVHLHTPRTSPASGGGVSVGRRRSGASSGRQSRQSSHHSPGPSPRPSLVPIGLQSPSGKHKFQSNGLPSPGPREEGDEDGTPGKTRSRRGEGEALPRANVSLTDLSPNKSKGDRKVKRKPRGGEEDLMPNKSSGSALTSYEGEKASSPSKQSGLDATTQSKETKKQPGVPAKSTELPLPEIVGVTRHSNCKDAPPKPLLATAPAPVKPSSVVKATEIPLTLAPGNSLPTSAKQKINNNSRLTLPLKETPSGLANVTKSSLQASPIKVKPTHVVAGTVKPPDPNLTLQVPSASKGPAVQLQLLASPTKKSNAPQLPATSTPFQNPTTKMPGKLTGVQPLADNSRSVPRKPPLQAGPSTASAAPNLVSSPDKLKRTSRVTSNSEGAPPGGLGVKLGQDANEGAKMNNAVGANPHPSPSPKQSPQHSGPRLDPDLTQSSSRVSGSTVGSADCVPFTSGAMGSPASPSLSPPLAPPGHLFTPLRGHFQRAVGTSVPMSYPSDSPAAKTWPRSREASRGGSAMAPSSFQWESESAGEGNLVFPGSGGNGNGCGVIGLRSGSRESSRKSSIAVDSMGSSMVPGPSGGLGSRKGSSAGLLEGSQSRRSSVFLDDTDPVAPPKHTHSITIIRKNSNFGNASFDPAGGGSLKQMFSPVVGASPASTSVLSAVSFANAESMLSPGGSGHGAPNASPNKNNNSNNNGSNNCTNNSHHSGNDNKYKAQAQGNTSQANSWGPEDVAAENNEGYNQSNANVSGHSNGNGNTIGNANANPIGNGRRTSGSGSSGLGLGPATPNPSNGLWVLSSLCRIAENMADAAAQAEHGVEEQADSEPAESSELARGKVRATPPAKSTTAVQERLQERIQSNASTEHLVHPFDNIYAAKSPLFPALPNSLGSAGALNLDAPNIATPRGGTEGKKLEFFDDEDEAYDLEDKADTVSTSGSAPAPGGVAFASQTNDPYTNLKHAEEVSLEPGVHQFPVHSGSGSMGNGPGGGNLGVGLGVMYGPGMSPLYRSNGGMHQHFFPPEHGPGKARGPNRGYFPLEHGHPHLHLHHGHLQHPHVQHAQQLDMELYPAYAGVDPNCGGPGGVLRSLRGPPVHPPHFPPASSPAARSGSDRLLAGMHHPHVPFSHVSLYEGSYPNPPGHYLGHDGGQPLMRKGNMDADELAVMDGFTGLPRGGFATNGSQFDPRFPGHFDGRYEATFDQCP